MQTLEQREKQVGRKFDFVYRYTDINGLIPDPAEKAVIARGSELHIAIAARDYHNPNKKVTYAAIAAGDYDADLKRQARGVAGLKVPVWMTFEQEANQRDKVGARGSAADFIRAWRHVHDVYTAAGATNAVWVWVMTGNKRNISRAATIWPGNKYVDWISWNVYNQSGCQQHDSTPTKLVSFEDGMKPFYDWVKKDGAKVGINTNLPMMISEMGSVQYTSDPQKSAQWYAQIPSVLAKYPQIKAATLWDSGGRHGQCNYRFEFNPTVLAGVRAAGLQSHVSSNIKN